ncbi:arabinan endo-1,5-alpha-L-arabinosidase [candidate division KSB1 bacterium]|nr:arabinan endo-1,5-alpha-L-arabinosidase [candidate division KSB1 bacterium]
MVLLIFLFLLQVVELSAQTGDIRAHDPVIIKQDSAYYVFCTGRGISIKRSPDLYHWEDIGRVFQEPPEWAVEAVEGFRGHIWAPDIFYLNGVYYLFYSISSFGKNTSCIGVATNKTLHPDDPDYQWIDHGKVVESVPNRDDWNAIDPNVVRDENGDVWMNFGSFWSGIKLVKLAPDLLKIETDPQEWYALARRARSAGIPDTQAGDGAIEAPFIINKNGYFYLFVSFDYCCRGVKSNYKIMVGRSESVTGPYLDREGKSLLDGGGTLVLAGDERWPGVGHNSVLLEEGNDWLVYHAYDAENEGRSALIIRELIWDEQGWPFVGEQVDIK